MVSLLGIRDELLKLVQDAFSVDVLVRGNDVNVTGPPESAAAAVRVVDELVKLLDAGQVLDRHTVAATVQMVRGDEHPNPSEVLSDEALTHRGRSIRPKTAGQKRYLDAIRRSTVTFGIGPAGTGKTYLAMAMAVLALKRKDVDRILLTRPAVEAGERLGFLPGTLFEKIDPYLRPLFDALHDMMDAEQLAILMERGTIEVAPLAFMRGRAQPVDTPVLTPWGFVPIGELRPGDVVTGADGQATVVLGVYPQGPKPVYRVTTQDGASTRACADHLWAVRTASDRRRGKPARILATDDMVGNLRAAHRHRYELPLVEPVAFVRRDVPMDAYALGLLLGDGCHATATTPTSTTTDTELVEALEAAIPGGVARRKGAIDYVLDRDDGRQAGVTVEDPVTGVLGRLGLAGTTSRTRFVPEQYLLNETPVRLAVLQGLLDTDGGPVRQAGRTCRVQYTTTSPQLRDDVVFLVRSLGGVASVHTRVADGRRPGLANGPSAALRSDAYVLDIHLPARIVPFRLRRKAESYVSSGGGRPMRFIDSIDAEGVADTVCIAVAADDALYVAEDFLVTHNTLNNSFIVLDEAQNTTPEQMKMFLTRLGFGSKAVVTGDVTQVDLPSGRHSGLSIVRRILTDIEGVEFCELTGRDVVRHRIVQEIVAAYQRWDDAVEVDDADGGGRGGSRGSER